MQIFSRTEKITLGNMWNWRCFFDAAR